MELLMKWTIFLLSLLLFTGWDEIGLGGKYPSIYTKNSSECGCGGVQYFIKNPNQSIQKVTLMRIRQSGTSPKKRQEVKMTLHPKIEKKLGCSQINLYIDGRSEFCDTTQSFYVKKYRELKSKD